jgi:hypothetical protein
MGCDPDRYQDSILNAEGAYGRCPATLCRICPSLYCQGFLAAFGGTGIADNYSGCSEYANDLPVIVDEDGNYNGRFSVAIQIPIFEIPLHVPLLRARFRSAPTQFTSPVPAAW